MPASMLALMRLLTLVRRGRALALPGVGMPVRSIVARRPTGVLISLSSSLPVSLRDTFCECAWSLGCRFSDVRPNWRPSWRCRIGGGAFPIRPPIDADE